MYYPGMEFDIPLNWGSATIGVSDSVSEEKKEGETPMPVTKVEDFEQFQNIISQEEKVLVKFEADWCMPCRAMVPLVEEFAKLYPDIKVLAVDVEGDGIDQALREYGVRSVPKFVYLREGEKVRVTGGAVSKSQLASLITD